MAEPSPGNPNGPGASTRSATAATFQVNDASLRDLRKTWQGLTQDVKNFGAALGDLKKHERDLDRLRQKLGQLGAAAGVPAATGGGGSSRVPLAGGSNPFAGRGGPVPLGMPGMGAPAGYRDNMGSSTPPAGGGRGGGGGGGGAGNDGGFGWRTAAKIGGVAGAAMVGYMGSRMGDISDADLFFNQQAQNTGYGYRNTEKNDARTAIFGTPGGGAYGSRQQVGGINGYTSVQDALGGAQTLFAATGGSTSNARAMEQLRNAGNMASLRPDAGLQGAATAAANLYDPRTSNRMMSLGITAPIGQGGRLASPAQVYASIIQRVYRGQKPTAQDITEGMQPGAPLYNTLVRGMGLGPDAIAEFQRYAIAQANLGGDAARTQRAITAAANMSANRNVSKADQRLVDQAGLRDSIRSRQNELGGAGARNTIEAGRQAEGTLESGFSALSQATDELTNAFQNLGDHVPGFKGGVGLAGLAASGVGGALGSLGGVGGAIFAGQGLRDLLGFGRGGGRGRGGGGAGGGGGGAPDPGGDTQRVFVTNWPDCICGNGGAGGGGGGGGDGMDMPDLDLHGGRGKGGSRFGRLLRGARGALGQEVGLGSRFGLAGRSATVGKIGLGLAAGATVGTALHYGRGYLKDHYGHEDDGKNWHWQDAAQGAAETLQYGAAGATAGGIIGGVPGAIVGGVAGSVFGAGKSVWDWWHDKQGYSRRKGTGPKATDAPNDPPADERFVSMFDASRGTNPNYRAHSSQPYTVGADNMPHYSKGGVVPGTHRRDDVDIKATPGEVVVPLNVVGRYGGADKLMKLLGIDSFSSSGVHYAKGGEVKPPAKTAANAGDWGDPGDLNNQVTVSAAGRTVQVHKRIAAQVRGFLNELVTSGYPLKSVGGFNNRNIAGSSKKSNHAWGAAIDIDPFAQGNGFDTGRTSKIGTGFKGDEWIKALAHKYNLGWGGEWKSKRDWMHFEAIGGPSSATYSGVAASGGATGGGDSTGNVPGAPIAPGRNLSFMGSPGADEKSALSRILANGSGPLMSLAASATGFDASPKTATAVDASPSTASNQQPPPASPTGNVATWVKNALGILHLDFDKYGPGIAALIQKESGGNPRAVNNWDSNAKKGTPSKGLMQTIDGTFKQYALSPYDKDIFDPVSNIIAGVRYAQKRYGLEMLAAGGRKDAKGNYKGYSSGTWETTEEVAQLHHGEMVVPATTAAKVRKMIRDQQTRGQREQTASPVTMSSGGSLRNVTLHIQAPVTIVGKATVQDARDFLGMVKDQAEQDKALDYIGAH